ncbi:MAG: HAMP domain-containing protein [Jatrophihabitans sp.]|nr:MAG: HAMP domain-containing protein [Jatrophihabitans sp.]
MSIRLRLSAVFTLAAIVIVGIGGYLYLGQLRQGLQNSIDQNLQTRAAAIAADLQTGAAALPDRTSGLGQLYRASGQLLDSTGPLRGDRLLTAAQIRAVAGGADLHLDSSITVRAPDESGTQTVRILATRGPGDEVIVVALERDLIDDAVHQATVKLVILGAVVIALAGPGSWLLARAALRPVERMRAQVARLDAAGAAEGVAVPRTRDEIARLGSTFNALLGRLHAALRREQAFVADAGHELRTPLTVLKGELQLAQRPGRSAEELRATVGIAAEETERLIRLTESLLVLARDSRPVLTRIDLADLTFAAAGGLAARAAESGVSVQVEADEAPAVDADPDRIRQVLDNLIANAIRHAPRGSTVTVRPGIDGPDAVVSVADRGPGFPPEFLPVAFERFTRADDARTRAVDSSTGSGLGLAIVAAIMDQHGGSATAADRPGGGAVVTVRWPRLAPADKDGGAGPPR